MGRGEPTYDLLELQRLIGQGPVSSGITGAARVGAELLDFGEDDIVEAVLQLSPANFYKTMESEACPGLWQDVYHVVYRNSWLYIKLQMGLDGRAVVVQFKPK